MSRFSIVKRGYDTAEVDSRVDELEAEIKEYREKNLSITNAIMSAQLAADDIRRKADEMADAIVTNARNMAARLSETSVGQINSIIGSVREQRKRLCEFKEEYAELLQRYILDMDENDISQAEKKSIELEGYLQKALDDAELASVPIDDAPSSLQF